MDDLRHTVPLAITAGGTVVKAAGALPWRVVDGELQVALVHRPAYDDWAWAKGKVDPGEDWAATAVREVHEETGLIVRLGRPLPTSTYHVVDKRGAVATKKVHYWAAEVTGGTGELVNEIDEVAWLDVPSAMSRLDYRRDRDQLGAVARFAEAGTLATWPLVLVRHAHALPRGKWSGQDPQRPLDDKGVRRAKEVVPLLGAFGVVRVVSSPSARCVDTVAPYATKRGIRLRTKSGLSEEGYAAAPDKAARQVVRALAKGRPVALCSHGPVLPALLEQLLERVAAQADPATGATLATARDADLDKGELLVAHIAGVGDDARVVAVERFTP